MITLPPHTGSLLAPAIALLLGLTLTGVPLFASRWRRRELQQRIGELERRCGEQNQALERSEAARMRSDAELRAAEQRYLVALRGSQDGVWEWDIASGRVELSPRWKSMLGFDAQALADDKAGWLSRVHPDDREGFEAALQRHLDGESAQFDHALRLLHRDGSVRHVLSRGVAIRRESGLAYRMIGLDTDVTSLRAVQAVLDAVADGTDGKRGELFFAALVEQFARALQVDKAFITECADEPPTRVRTIAYWSRRTGARASVEFALAGTPCEEVVQQGKVCFHPEQLEQLFPLEAGYASYLGMPIQGSGGQVLGHLAFFDTRPRGDDLLLDRVYRIFLPRIAAEMERLRSAA